MRVWLGLDIGGTTIKGVAVHADSPTMRIAQETHRTRQGADGVVTGAVDMIAALSASLPVGADVAGIGMGIPGLVQNGTVTSALNLGIDRHPLDLAGEVASRTSGIPVLVENDVKTAALGGRLWLQEKGPDEGDLGLLNIGTGLAAGLLLDGQIRRGSQGLAGEIGHLPYQPNGPSCQCGRRGCLELYASGSGLRREWDGTAAELFTAAGDGDLEAQRISFDMASGISHAINMLAYLPDVAVVLVTGGVISSTPALRAAILEQLRSDEQTALGRIARVVDRVRWLPSDYPAGALGAVMLNSVGAGVPSPAAS